MIYTNTEFKGYWPIGAAAIVEAESPEEAAKLLEEKLDTIGLTQHILVHDMQEYNGGVLILRDGNY